MDRYPSHRYHPTLKEGEFVNVVDEDQDNDLMSQDSAWRDLPYTDAEREEYAKMNPKSKRAQGPPPRLKTDQAVQAQGASLAELQRSIQTIGNTVNDLMQRVMALESDNAGSAALVAAGKKTK